MSLAQGQKARAARSRGSAAGSVTTSPGKIRLGSPDRSVARFAATTRCQYAATASSSGRAYRVARATSARAIRHRFSPARTTYVRRGRRSRRGRRRRAAVAGGAGRARLGAVPGRVGRRGCARPARRSGRAPVGDGRSRRPAGTDVHRERRRGRGRRTRRSARAPSCRSSAAWRSRRATGGAQPAMRCASARSPRTSAASARERRDGPATPRTIARRARWCAKARSSPRHAAMLPERCGRCGEERSASWPTRRRSASIASAARRAESSVHPRVISDLSEIVSNIDKMAIEWVSSPRARRRSCSASPRPVPLEPVVALDQMLRRALRVGRRRRRRIDPTPGRRRRRSRPTSGTTAPRPRRLPAAAPAVHRPGPMARRGRSSRRWSLVAASRPAGSRRRRSAAGRRSPVAAAPVAPAPHATPARRSRARRRGPARGPERCARSVPAGALCGYGPASASQAHCVDRRRAGRRTRCSRRTRSRRAISRRSASVSRAGVRRQPACAQGGEDERSWSRPTAPRLAVGRYACRIEQGRAAMWWTVDDRGLLAHATSAGRRPRVALRVVGLTRGALTGAGEP